MTIKEQWECGRCLDLHDTEDAAAECCPPEINRVWVCSECGEAHLSKDDAEACHPDDESNGRVDGGLIFPSPKLANNQAAYIAEFHKLNGLRA